MSKGPGKVQRFVLDQLRQEGGYIYANILAQLWDEQQPGGDSQVANRSLMRAVTVLARQGILNRATLCERMPSGRRRVVVCWLPGQEPPQRPGSSKPSQPGDHYGERYGKSGLRVATVEAIVRSLLASHHKQYGEAPMAYADLVGEVEQHTGERYVYVPLRRAVLRLQREGVVSLEYTTHANGRQRIHAVRLRDRVSVH